MQITLRISETLGETLKGDQGAVSGHMARALILLLAVAAAANNQSWYVFKPEKGGTPVLGAPVACRVIGLGTRAALTSDTTQVSTPAAPTSGDTAGKPCAAATVLPFEATRPFDPEAELLRVVGPTASSPTTAPVGGRVSSASVLQAASSS